MPNIKHSDIVAYLNAIADKADGDADAAKHKRFWNTMSYADFKSKTVPNELTPDGKAIPILDKDPAKCPLYQALINSSGWQKLGQMPLGGDYINDPAGYTVTINNVAITGAQIDQNIVWWLTHDMPE